MYVTGGEGVLWGSAVYLYTSIGVDVVCYQLPLMTVGAVAITDRFMYIYSLEQYLQSTTQSAGYTRLSSRSRYSYNYIIYIYIGGFVICLCLAQLPELLLLALLLPMAMAVGRLLRSPAGGSSHRCLAPDSATAAAG